MRYHCYGCNKSVTSELPEDSVIRALLLCPECIELIPEKGFDYVISQKRIPKYE